ncbi:hypothetical protein B0T17DRAFT_485101 [Bombardia bombarda]|uniref:G-protein coupled receptors family 2 profile 2 domain-containing protein n=1 Tax=Bombardia bombarda TaxID=252184 RepID=A0AA39XKG9_9PEZI|nr:hypothetical protein B0T17DRAFT_485101 [Bombardia bombarda]
MNFPVDADEDVFTLIERTCSVFSLLGCVFIIGTFCFCKAFHKPINRLVFYASFGNLMTNVATLMARTFVSNAGSAGCQFQAFLIQMFMPADAFWTLAMAVNVYLTFYFKYDARRLRKMELPYLIACYGVPFIIAFSFIFISSPTKGHMYGNANLWCWVSHEWHIFRIATFYAPVWIVILITFFIYIRAGNEIYKKHKQLREFSYSFHEPEPLPAMDDAFSSRKTTEVRVTSEVVGKSDLDLSVLDGVSGPRHGSSSSAAPQTPNAAAYSVTISSSKQAAAAADALAAAGHDMESYGDTRATTAMATATTAPQPPRAAYEANSATWSYTKCSLLFFTAMLVTWLPSSANRVYSVVHTNKASMPLEYMSAFVLPLQGFWNAIIYIVTSWKACEMLYDDLANRFRQRRSGRNGGAKMKMNMMMSKSSSNSSGKTYETESMTELARSRPSTNGERSSLPREPPQVLKMKERV